jgi:hypothetical protein
MNHKVHGSERRDLIRGTLPDSPPLVGDRKSTKTLSQVS